MKHRTFDPTIDPIDPEAANLAAVLRVAALSPAEMAAVVARVLRDVAGQPSAELVAERDQLRASARLAEQVRAELRAELDATRDRLAALVAEREQRAAEPPPAPPEPVAPPESDEERRRRLGRERAARFRAARQKRAAASVPAPEAKPEPAPEPAPTATPEPAPEAKPEPAPEAAPTKRRGRPPMTPEEKRLRELSRKRRTVPVEMVAPTVPALAPAPAPMTEKESAKDKRRREVAAAFAVVCPSCGANAHDDCAGTPPLAAPLMVRQGTMTAQPHGERLAAGRRAWASFVRIRDRACPVCPAKAGERCRDGGERAPGFATFHRARAE